MKSFLFGIVSLLAAGSAVAGELVVTAAESTSKSGVREIAIDLATAGDVSGFNFLVRLPDTKVGSVDTSKCLDQLPKGWSGACNQTEEGVYFFAMANGKTTLPAGISAVGSIRVPLEGLGKVGISTDHLVLADAEGNAISSTSQVAE